jgi:hypothetical protein
MILEFERGSTRSHFVENSLWQSLWTCRKAEHGIKATQSHVGLLASGLARHMLVCVCLVSSNLNGHAEPEKFGPLQKQLPFKSVC